jgi:acid ceramidase
MVPKVNALMDEIYSILPPALLEKFVSIDEDKFDTLLDRFPNNYGDEIRGIGEQVGLNSSSMFIFNIAYELLGACTSVVVENENGHITHGRNLDFGLFLGWNKSEKTWATPELLRDLLVNVDFQRNGETVFQTVSYVGYVGVHTGYIPGQFSLTVDTRFDMNFDRFLMEWINEPTDTDQFLTMHARATFESEQALSYTAAVKAMSTTPFVGPAYVIIGGINKGEGVVLTISPHNDTALDVWPIQQGMPEDEEPWYVLETNYDHWTNAPFYDDRRTPAEACLKEIGSGGMNFTSLYTVLHATPSRNQLTTFTVLFDTKKGKMESYLEACWPEQEEHCSIW